MKKILQFMAITSLTRNWSGGSSTSRIGGAAVFERSRDWCAIEYCLFQRGVLMDKFWPDADPESARNSLNVALHSLRQALRSITSLPVIQFENGKYFLNPDLQVWVDVEEFEQHQKDGNSMKEQAR
jgi:hypothetical protein